MENRNKKRGLFASLLGGLVGNGSKGRSSGVEGRDTLSSSGDTDNREVNATNVPSESFRKPKSSNESYTPPMKDKQLAIDMVTNVEKYKPIVDAHNKLAGYHKYDDSERKLYDELMSITDKELGLAKLYELARHVEKRCGVLSSACRFKSDTFYVYNVFPYNDKEREYMLSMVKLGTETREDKVKKHKLYPKISKSIRSRIAFLELDGLFSFQPFGYILREYRDFEKYCKSKHPLRTLEDIWIIRIEQTNSQVGKHPYSEHEQDRIDTSVRRSVSGIKRKIANRLYIEPESIDLKFDYFVVNKITPYNDAEKSAWIQIEESKENGEFQDSNDDLNPLMIFKREISQKEGCDSKQITLLPYGYIVRDIKETINYGKLFSILGSFMRKKKYNFMDTVSYTDIVQFVDISVRTNTEGTYKEILIQLAFDGCSYELRVEVANTSKGIQQQSLLRSLSLKSGEVNVSQSYIEELYKFLDGKPDDYFNGRITRTDDGFVFE